MSDVDRPKAMPDTPGPSKNKKDDEVQYVHSTSMKSTSISPMQGGDGEELGGTEVEKNKGEVTLPREEEDPSKKRKITPPNPSSKKKTKATQTTFKTTLTPDDFDFLIVALNDASLEIAEKKEENQEEVFIRIKGELQEV
jgi:heme-binding NEAT domain protein